MKTSLTKKIVVGSLSALIFFGMTTTTFAQLVNLRDYTVLAPLPGTTNCADNALGSDCKTTLERYLPGVFNLLIGLAGVFAVLMIVIGGFQYISSDALQGKEDGRARIWNAVRGLILVIAATVILYTINPNLLQLNLNLAPITVTAPPAGTLTAPPANVGTCVSCTSVNGLPLSARVAQFCATTSEGCFINSDLAARLRTLNGLTITEAWPPSRTHQSGCHQDGSCVDAVIGNMTNANSVQQSIREATNAGLTPVFESNNEALINELVRLGLPRSCNSSQPSVCYLPTCTTGSTGACITGTHFSIYKK